MKDFNKIFHHSNQSMKDYYHHCSALKLRELNTYLTNNIEYIVVWCEKQTKGEHWALGWEWSGCNSLIVSH